MFGPPERVISRAEAAVQPLLETGNDAVVRDEVRAALADVSARRTASALARADAITQPGAAKLVRWATFRRLASGARAEDIEAFRLANPTWPEQDLLRQRAEEALLLANARPTTVRRFFKATPPQSGAGKAALGAALMADGKPDEGAKLISAGFRHGRYGATIEARLLKRFPDQITQADIRWRLDQYLLDDDRYGRRQRLAVIRRMISLLKGTEKAKAEARLAVWRTYGRARRNRMARATTAMAALNRRLKADQIPLPIRKTTDVAGDVEKKEEITAITASVDPTAAVRETQKTASTSADADAPSTRDWPLELSRAQLARRKGQHQRAIRILLDAPEDTSALVAPDEWWIERRVNIFNALYRKDYRTAYALASKRSPLSTNARNEALFMAGWIAFRFLEKAEQGRIHLEAFTQSADGPRTRAQSHYWLGRVHDVLGNEAAARDAYTKAATEFATFYGQLARHKLEPDATTLAIPERPELTPDLAKATADNDLLQALRYAHIADASALRRRLIRGISRSRQSPAIYELAAQFAISINDTQMSVRIGKAALFHGVPLVDYAYPTHAFPLFKPVVTPPEPAMLYGLARQESEFNTLIKSIAGARGVLQVMPPTARDVCRTHNLKCGSRRALTRRLSADPAYNAALASAYLTGRLEEFTGSYILTYAGYNAGPGRARYWIRKSGDPRARTVDPIDWIELIHIKETREYVKKVMANLQVYRGRLGAPETALQISKDIERGSF
ncbi:MAG: lytic transglycosylase domain-containing protein [Pseudomonadota bacterium]